jgi:NAD(P)H-quinone oxidoreductase subunit I
LKIPSYKFCGHVEIEFDNVIACKLCVCVCLINLCVVGSKLRKNKRKKQQKNSIFDFGDCIFGGNCVRYYFTKFLLMIE